MALILAGTWMYVIHVAIKLKAIEVSNTISWQPQQTAVSHLKNHFWQLAVHALFKNQHFQLTITFIVIGPEERIQEFFPVSEFY